MRHEIDVALTGLITEEQKDVLLSGYDVLQTVGLSDVDVELQTVLGLQDGISDSYLLVSRLQDVLLLATGGCLNQYGIVLRDDTPFPVMSEILLGLATFENQLLPEHMMEILEADDLGNIEKTAEILAITTSENEDTLYEYIVDVRESLLVRMVNVLKEAFQLKDVEPEDAERTTENRYRARQIHHLCRGFDGHPTIVFELASSGVAMGTPIHLMVPDVFDQLDALSTGDLAVELLGLIWYSDTPMNNSPKVLENYLEDFNDDYEAKMRGLETVSDYLEEWQDDNAIRP
jgi:hypothetical protein